MAIRDSGTLLPHQAGFRGGYAYIDQEVLLEDEIQASFLNREHGVAVFFDLERAYDRTWRYGVLRKCHEFGLRG